MLYLLWTDATSPPGVTRSEGPPDVPGAGVGEDAQRHASFCERRV